MKFKVELNVTIEVDAVDGREALPAAIGYFQEAMDWASEHYEGEMVRAVEWTSGALKQRNET